MWTKIYFLILLIFADQINLFANQKNSLKLNIKEIPIDPQNTSAVLEIGVMIFVIDLEPFRELDMDYRIDYLMKQIWFPYKNFCLTIFDDLEISPIRKKPLKQIVLYEESDLKRLWLPDTFASNSKDERISSDTDILEMVLISTLNDDKCVIEYWSKLNAKLSCSLYLKYYPFDQQYCNMTIRSYAVHDKLLKYRWINAGDDDYRAYRYDKRVFLTNGVVLLYPLRLVEYEIEAFSSNYTDNLFFRSSSLYVTFVYKRKIFGNLIMVYVPSVLLFLVSLLSLWINIDEVGRVLNCMTCFLSLLTQFIHVRSELPVISYINGTDYWILSCLTFVFLNLVQFTLIKYLQNNVNSETKLNSKSNLNDEKTLNYYLMQKNKEKFQMIKKLKLINKNKSREYKRTELIKYLALLQLPTKDRLIDEKNKRLSFVSNKDTNNLNFKSFLTNYDQFNNERPIDFDNNSIYDKSLKDRIDRLVKYNSSSSSSSDSESEEEENWYQKIKQDYNVIDLINRIDYISRYLFILSFMIFNFIYWPYMIIASKQ